MTTSESPRAGSPPDLYAGQPPREIVAPVALVGDDRVELACRYGERWGLPLRFVHVQTPQRPDDDSALAGLVARSLDRFPGLVIRGETVAATSVATGIGSAATDRSLVFLPSARGSRWLDEESIGVAVVQRIGGLVMLFGPDCHDPAIGTSLIVPLDGTRFAEQALEPAVAVAASSGATIWLVTVGPAASVDAVSEMMLEGVGDAERRYLERLAARYDDSPLDVRWATTDGDPIAGIGELATEHGSSLVVAATHGDIGGQRSEFGSVCLGLVEHGRVPTLLVTPGPHDPS